MKCLTQAEQEQVAGGIVPALVAAVTIVGPHICEAIAVYGAYQTYHIVVHNEVPTFDDYITKK